ncbi:MAG: hypothetical protein QOI41_2909 [Myxococcales bacterium]|jgi:hypothetical protein|nr:hypothetical protein [Myxococcales bacterium]
MPGVAHGTRAIGAALFAGLCFAVASSACRASAPLGGFDEPPDGAPPPLATEAGSPKSDANAARALCAATACPAPYATCSDDSFRCETNFDSDDTSCGACGVTCPNGEAIRNLLGADFHCQSGVCRMACNSDPFNRKGDCNHDVADGCEVDLQCDDNNCGACGVKCPGGLPCIQGNCGCPAGLTTCSPGCGAECLDLRSDDANCGTCGTECAQGATPPGPFMHVGCSASTCGAVKCDQGRGDCNGDVADGCEIDLSSDAKNCNVCGNACAAGQECENGKCKCAPSETRCPDFGTSTHCADLATDAQNCGACGNRCPNTEYPTKSVCRLGRCELQCPTGHADCDGDPSNGCETLVSSDPRNCGACGVHCDLVLGQPCVDGACLQAPCDVGPPQ